MPGTVLLLAAAPAGKGCLVDAASVLPVLAAVPPTVLSGTDTANVVELADPLEPQAVLTRLRAAAASPAPLTLFVTGQLHLDRRQHLPHLALARTTPSTVRYTSFPWHWFREELRLRAPGSTSLLLDLHADAETWEWLGTHPLDSGPNNAVYGRVAPPPSRRTVAGPAYMKAVATLLRSGHRPPLDQLHQQALTRVSPDGGSGTDIVLTAYAPAQIPPTLLRPSPQPSPALRSAPLLVPSSVRGFEPSPAQGPAYGSPPLPTQSPAPGSPPLPTQSPAPGSLPLPAESLGEGSPPLPPQHPSSASAPNPAPAGASSSAQSAEPSPAPGSLPLPAGSLAAGSPPPPLPPQDVPSSSAPSQAQSPEPVPEPVPVSSAAPRSPSLPGESPAPSSPPALEGSTVQGSLLLSPQGVSRGSAPSPTQSSEPVPVPSSEPSPTLVLPFPPQSPAASPSAPPAHSPAPSPVQGPAQTPAQNPPPHDPHATIAAAVESGRHGEAEVLAAHYEQTALRAHGPASEAALHWIDVRADLAMMAGDPVRSCRAWLMVASARLSAGQAPDTPAVEAAVDRAHHQWGQIHDTGPARELGSALAELRGRVPGRRRGALENVRQRLRQMQTQG